MKLYIMEEEVKLPEGLNAEEIFNVIEEKIFDRGEVINCIFLDDFEVNNNHQKVIEERFHTISKIHVKSSSIYQLAVDNIRAVEKYLVNIIPEVESIGVDFQQEVTREVWESFETTIRGLIFVSETMAEIMGILTASENDHLIGLWGEVMNEYDKITDILNELEDLLDKEDTVKCGNLLQFDIAGILKSVQNKIKVSTMLLV